MGKIEIRYNWSYYDPVRKRRCRTSYKTTEESIKREYPDATPIEATREELELIDEQSWLVNSTSAFQCGVADIGNGLIDPDKRKPPTRGG